MRSGEGPRGAVAAAGGDLRRDMKPSAADERNEAAGADEDGDGWDVRRAAAVARP